ncbi:MAG TPA: ABC transporter substrate-binding protein [Thermoanaerobaculia bacterium]|nr:ABC transporter substrate-binding protein [Thermoanaerobaculia bacterium]
MGRRRSALAFLLVLGLACGRETRVEAPAAPAVVDDTPQDGGTLYRRLDIDVTTLNPVCFATKYDRYPTQYLFTPLVYLDQSLRPIPGLAKSWDVSDDGTLYTFKLNEKATFSDGTPVRASDVLFTLTKILDPASEAVQIASSFEHLDLTRTRVVDEHTITVAFRQPLAMQLVRFSDVNVLPEHVYSKKDFRNGFNDSAVGSGPYRLVRRVPGKEIVLERRPDYWGERPHIQTVVLKVINDHNTAWNAVRIGEIDETIVASDTWYRERNNPSLTKILDFPRFYTLNYNYIAWNHRDPLLRDKRVRRALAMCVPMDAIIQDIYHGTARAMIGPFTPDEFAYNPAVQPIRYDPEGARRELESLGWRDSDGDGVLDRDGKPLSLSMIMMSGSATTRQFGQAMQDEMKRVGIGLQIDMLEGAMAIQRIIAGNYQAAYLAWELDPDPDPSALFHSTQTPPRGQNFIFYANPEVDRLIDQARHEMDFSKRKELYWQLHQLLADEQPYTWTVQVSSKWAINKRVRGVAISRAYGLYLWYPGELGWWIAKDAQPPAGKRP